MHVLGITGGIGSGKSTISMLMKQKKYCQIIDSDLIAKILTKFPGETMEKIKSVFGESVIDSIGGLNRQAMRIRIFECPTERIKLEEILHPLIILEVLRQLKLAHNRSLDFVIIEIPLLAEKKILQYDLDRILIVDCLVEHQIARLKKRNGFSESDIILMIKSQANRSDRRIIADVVISNHDLDIEYLEREVSIFMESFA